MTINICQTNAGILGQIRVSPEAITIPKDTNKSSDIEITIESFTQQSSLPVIATGQSVVETSREQQEEVTVIVNVKDQFSNNIEGIDFEFSDFDILAFSIEKDIENNSFSYIIRNVFSSSVLNSLKFNIVKTNKFIADIEAIINFNAISSGFGTATTALNIRADSSELAATVIEENISQDGFFLTSGDTIDTSQEEVQIENIFSAKINSQYNFYISKYENFISEISIPENALPNINYLYTETNIRNISLNNAKTLTGLLNEKVGLNRENNSINRPADIKDFFEEFTLDVSTEIDKNDNYLSIYRRQFHNLFSNNYSKNLLLDVENKEQNFPMLINFEILLENNKTQLNTFLKKLNILDYFCYCLVNEFTNPSTININTEQFFNKYFSNTDSSLSLQRPDFIYLGDIGNISAFNGNTRTNFLKSISSSILKNKYPDFFRDIPGSSVSEQSGEKRQAYNIMRSRQIKDRGSDQVIMYEVHKKFGNTTISRNYFINDFETQFLKFYDTQVKYDKEYSYEINKIVCLDTIITKTNILSKKLKVFDLPPISPQVDYIGYKGQDNKILITLNSGTGKIETHPQIILEEDKEKFENNIAQQERTDNKIKFASDDITAEFELMRLDTEPYSYEDFSNGKIINLSNKINGVIKFAANSFVDDIQPNKKYYYIARSKDVHNNISNPTSPMEIQMINENGTIYLIKKEYIFKNIPKKPTKEFKKYIEIKVAENQASINPQTFNNNSQTAQNLQVYLGNAEKSVWEKQFLLRVTSKTTGKKVDVKFKFNFTQPSIPQTA